MTFNDIVHSAHFFKSNPFPFLNLIDKIITIRKLLRATDSLSRNLARIAVYPIIRLNDAHALIAIIGCARLDLSKEVLL